eukprot:GHVU01061782.1.p4 GENE.GHVU01061782.1~~GHVU01061782.1.p4  ORF type:complete len:103 (+),score=6.66 GHVU01061782.1:1097-1405(+)
MHLLVCRCTFMSLYLIDSFIYVFTFVCLPTIRLSFLQGEIEEKLGLPISPLCDRKAHLNMAKSQCGFIEFVVQVCTYVYIHMHACEMLLDGGALATATEWRR